MSIDLSKMDELVCPDCGKPLVALPVAGVPNRYTFESCRCGRESFEIPDCTIAGFSGAPMFFYVPMSKD
jgi:hypothetical protein